ncbi:MAG: DUF4439 domain-containing protein [Streptosporangiales bacterium]|nr:DUF4439 domain-containing protein [Streptosporangiales bacterium]
MTPPETPEDPLAAGLQAALAAEHAAIYGYGIVGAYLLTDQRAVARQAWDAHRRRRDRLRAILAARGVSPVSAAPAYRLPRIVDGPQSAARLAARLEEGAVDAYLGLVAVDDPGLRRYAAQAMQDCARRAAHWRGSTSAFPGLPPRAIYGPTRKESPRS